MFERVSGGSMRPGPAPLTDTERQTAQARAFLGTPATGTESPAAQPEATPEPEVVPTYAADPGARLEEFLAAHGEWQKSSTWSDDTTHAIHESQTLRIERVHEAAPADLLDRRRVRNPVSERMWHLTATDTAPAPVLQALLNQLAGTDTWETALGSPITDKTVTEATRPLTDAGWKHTVDGRWIRWPLPPRKMPECNSMPSPLRTPATTSPPGPCGQDRTPTASPGPSTPPHTPPQLASPTSPENRRGNRNAPASRTVGEPANSKRAHAFFQVVPPSVNSRALLGLNS